MLWLQVREDKENMEEHNSSQTRHWRDLMSHSNQLLTERRPELEQDYRQLGTALSDQEMPDWESFLTICGKILTNCFCLRSDRWEPGRVENIFQILEFSGKSR